MLLDKKFFLIILGSALEYYDFVLYGLLATHISKAFFPSLNSRLQLIQAFGIFALGYLVRPLAGTILGIISDRYCQVKVFAYSILLMGLSTFFIGILPSYSQIGIAAPLFLLFARLLQGVSFALEIPGAVTILSESYAKKNIPNSIGHLMSSTNFGFIMASVIIYLVHLCCTAEQVLNWGWRIPFILGGLLAFVSYYIRRDLTLSPDLQKYNKISLKDFFTEIFVFHFTSILKGIGITSITASGTMFFIYLPHLLEEYYTLKPQTIRLYFFIGLIAFMIFCLVFGKLLKESNIIRFFIGTILTFPIIVYFLIFQINFMGGESSLLLLFVLYEIYMAALFTSGLSILSQLFPTQIRNTCISWCYNFSFSVFSFMPAIVTFFITKTHRAEYITLLFFALSIILTSSFLSKKLFFYKNKT